MEARLQTSNFKVMEAEVVAREAEDGAQATEPKAQAIEAQATSISARALEKYKKSMNFKDEVIKGSYDVYQLGFTECKKKVVEAFPRLNLDGIVSIKPIEKGKAEEECEAKEVEESTKGATDIKIGQAIIEVTIAKVMAKAETMINATVKAFKAGSTLALKESSDNPEEKILIAFLSLLYLRLTLSYNDLVYQ